MKRALFIGAGLFIAIATAVPLYLAAADRGGDRRPAALEEEEQQILNCSFASNPESCLELARLLQTLDDDLVALRERLRAAEPQLLAIQENETFQSDDDQLAGRDLQNILQKQQQTLQMLSNISKMLFDTAQSIIRKIGG